MYCSNCMAKRTSYHQTNKLISVLPELPIEYIQPPCKICKECRKLTWTYNFNHRTWQVNGVHFNQWSVCSQTYHETKHAVVLEGTCSEAWRFVCPECKVCVQKLSRNHCKHIHTVFASGAATSNDPDIGMGDVRMPQVSLQKLVKVLWRKSN